MGMWYYYTGSKPESIPVGNGVSVAVVPRTKVEVHKMTQKVMRLVSRGLLRRTGPPLGERVPDIEPKHDENIGPVKKDFANSTIELGTVSDASSVPAVVGSNNGDEKVENSPKNSVKRKRKRRKVENVDNDKGVLALSDEDVVSSDDGNVTK